MPWVRIDDQYAQHPKMLDAGPDALTLDISGMCYSAAHLTDGFIPTGALTVLGPARNPRASAKTLERVGRWEKVEGGWQIHDWSHYQPTAEQVEAERRANRERMQRWRNTKRSGASNAVTGPATNGVSDGPVTLSPSPSPLKAVTQSSSKRKLVEPESPDDDDRLRQAKTQAEADLADRETAKGPVADRAGWLAAATQRRLDEPCEPTAPWDPVCELIRSGDYRWDPNATAALDTRTRAAIASIGGTSALAALPADQARTRFTAAWRTTETA